MTTIVPQFLQIWVVKCVCVICGINYMKYKWKKVTYPGCPYCNWKEVKETVLHQLQCTALPRIRVFKDIIDYLYKRMKVKETKPTMCTILCLYIIIKCRKPCQDSPHLPMETPSVAKSQDSIGRDNIIQGRISIHWNNQKSDYLNIYIYKKRRL